MMTVTTTKLTAEFVDALREATVLHLRNLGMGLSACQSGKKLEALTVQFQSLAHDDVWAAGAVHTYIEQMKTATQNSIELRDSLLSTPQARAAARTKAEIFSVQIFLNLRKLTKEIKNR